MKALCAEGCARQGEVFTFRADLGKQGLGGVLTTG